MNTETETPSEYGSDKPVGDVGDVGEVVAGLQKLMSYHEDLMDRDRAPIHVAISALQSQARENAEKDYRIASLETTLANDPKHWGVHKQIAELTAENAALESTIEGLELDIEGYQQKSQELKDESILSDIAFDQMQSDIETLTAENAALKQGWISVDTPPVEMEQVMLWLEPTRYQKEVDREICHQITAAVDDDGKWYDFQTDIDIDTKRLIPTRWQPLPSPPNSRNAEAARIRGEK